MVMPVIVRGVCATTEQQALSSSVRHSLDAVTLKFSVDIGSCSNYDRIVIDTWAASPINILYLDRWGKHRSARKWVLQASRILLVVVGRSSYVR